LRALDFAAGAAFAFVVLAFAGAFFTVALGLAAPVAVLVFAVPIAAFLGVVLADDTTFFVGAAFFADDGLALALAVGAVTRLAGAGALAAVAFLGAADLATGFVLVFGTVLAAVLVADLGLILAAAEVFLGTAALGVAFALVAFAAVDLAVEAFAGVLDAALVVLLPLLIGLFSLAESFLAASLTLPEGPLGRENVPLSAPFLIERLSWLLRVGVNSIFHLVSMYFFRPAREIPVRSAFSTIASEIISTKGGWSAV